MTRLKGTKTMASNRSAPPIPAQEIRVLVIVRAIDNNLFVYRVFRDDPLGRLAG